MAEYLRDFWSRLQQLRAQGVPVATATVVARRSPVSAHLGDRALVFADGRMDGFAGGACSREIVRRHALAALRTGRPRLLEIRPGRQDGERDDGERFVAPMTCASEGSADIYIEPLLPPPFMIVVGFTPVAAALTRLALVLDYRVARVVEDAERGDAAAEGVDVVDLSELAAFLRSLTIDARERAVAIVASQGHYDEAALEPLLRANTGYVGLLAGRKRGAAVKDALAALYGLDEAALGRIHTPVGIDIGATSAPDVAVSILADVVRHRAQAAPIGDTDETGAGDAIDPVCGMTVERLGAKHTAEYNTQTYAFCSARCEAAFRKTPSAFVGVVP